MKQTPKGWPRLSSSLFYEDAAAAIDWLCRAFDFQVRLKIDGERRHGRPLGARVRRGGDHGLQRLEGEGVREPASLWGRQHPEPLHLCRRRRRALRARPRGRREDPEGAHGVGLRRGVLGRSQLRGRRSRGAPLVVCASGPRVTGALDGDRRSITRSRALADPTRRRVVDLLARSRCARARSRPRFAMSAPAMSRHLRVLRQSGLVEEEGLEEDARVRVYRLRPERFAALRGWLDEVEGYWNDQLAAFKAHAERRKQRARARSRPRPAKLGRSRDREEALVKAGDRARASTFVAVEPLETFEVFTSEIDLWWGRGPRFRFGGKRRGTLTFEPGVGGRLLRDLRRRARLGVRGRARARVGAGRAPGAGVAPPELRAGRAHRGRGPLRSGQRRHARDRRAPRVERDPRRPPRASRPPRGGLPRAERALVGRSPGGDARPRPRLPRRARW